MSQIQTPGGYTVATADAAIKLDANENPFGLVTEIRQELMQRASQLDASRYPDAQAFAVRSQLADYVGLPAEQLVVGNGSDELIQLVLLTFRGTVERVVLPTPTFGMYRVAAVTAGLGVREVPLGPGFSLDSASIGDQVSPETGVVLCVPNNPTGNCFSSEAVEQVLRSEAGLIIIDEAYFEFAGRTLIDRVTDDPRLIVMRTLSKAFALAGLRVGYLAAHPETAARIRTTKAPYNVNSFSQLAATVVLQHREAQLRTVPRIMTESDVLYDRLRGICGLTVYPSQANFFLVEVDETASHVDAPGLWHQLRQRDISVRHYPNEPILASYLRISVGTADENATLVRALTDILGNVDGTAPSRGG